jgi:cyclophilin family peptidyl-prolyl cis-trans isomerase
MTAAEEAGAFRVRLETARGSIVLEIEGAAAPAAAANFHNLVRAGFYDGMPFHRVEPGFVIQAGDPARVGRPPVGYTIPDEGSSIRHIRGTVAMARIFAGGEMVPNSASTQFYICLGEAPHLDEMGFTAFGRVVEGDEVLDDIQVGDEIIRAVLEVAGGGSR